jgi:hypothetical protein
MLEFIDALLLIGAFLLIAVALRVLGRRGH